MSQNSDAGNFVEGRFIAVGATFAGVAVALGAFGAHALKGHIDTQALGWWQTAVQFQMWHALAILGIGFSAWRQAQLTAWLFAAGTFVFSGTLYALALGAPHWVGAVTPIGGFSLICGWALLAWRASR